MLRDQSKPINNIVNFRLDAGTRHSLTVLAEMEKASVSDLIRGALRTAIAAKLPSMATSAAVSPSNTGE